MRAQVRYAVHCCMAATHDIVTHIFMCTGVYIYVYVSTRQVPIVTRKQIFYFHKVYAFQSRSSTVNNNNGAGAIYRELLSPQCSACKGGLKSFALHVNKWIKCTGSRDEPRDAHREL